MDLIHPCSQDGITGHVGSHFPMHLFDSNRLQTLITCCLKRPTWGFAALPLLVVSASPGGGARDILEGVMTKGGTDAQPHCSGMVNSNAITGKRKCRGQKDNWCFFRPYKPFGPPMCVFVCGGGGGGLLEQGGGRPGEGGKVSRGERSPSPAGTYPNPSK